MDKSDDMNDDEIIRELHAAVAEERRSLRRVLIALRSFDASGLASKRGFGSTFDYCVRELGYSGSAAYKRVHAARLSAQHPEIVDKIESGRLSLSTVAAVYAHAKKDAAILAAVEGKTCREVEAFVASLSPVERPRDAVQVIALVPSAPEAPPETAYRMHLTLGETAHAKLRRATDLLRHRHPGGEPHVIVEDALDALLDRIDRDRKDKPSPKRPVEPGGRRIPEWVKDEVWKRDGGRCAFEADGRRCGASAWLQYDHIVPYALGGVSDRSENVRLLCGAHNRQAARDAGLTASSPGSSVDA